MPKEAKVFKGKKMLLAKIPEDVQKMIIERQQKEKSLCECERAQEWAIYKIIREHNALTTHISSLYHLGHAFPVSPNCHLEGNEFVINLTVKVPITHPMGMAMNYARIKEADSKN